MQRAGSARPPQLGSARLKVEDVPLSCSDWQAEEQRAAESESKAAGKREKERLRSALKKARKELKALAEAGRWSGRAADIEVRPRPLSLPQRPLRRGCSPRARLTPATSPHAHHFLGPRHTPAAPAAPQVLAAALSLDEVTALHASLAGALNVAAVHGEAAGAEAVAALEAQLTADVARVMSAQ